jgi:hypothetical protein
MTHRDFEMTEEERALEKKIRRENIKEVIGAILFAVGMAALFILYLFATPDQMSAECEYLRYQMQQAAQEQRK